MEPMGDEPLPTVRLERSATNRLNDILVSWKDYPDQSAIHKDLSPSRGSSNTPDFENLSITTALDYGFAAAELQHGGDDSLSDTEPLPVYPSDMTGVGDHLTGNPLKDSIRESLVSRAGDWNHARTKQKKWLPIDSLYRIFNRNRILQELHQAFGDQIRRGETTNEKLRRYVDKIAPPKIAKPDEEDRPGDTGCRRIFAVLVMSDKVKSIVDFIDAKVCDGNLNSFPHLSHTVPNWDEDDSEQFERHQPCMFSPFFNLRSDKVPFHSFDHDTVLPFIEDQRKIDLEQGGHGLVWRVKIHAAHHDMHQNGDPPSPNPNFALKRLHDCQGKSGFEAEVRGFAKSTNGADHPHLIKLLAAWSQDEGWFLLFPWAQMNVKQYWKQEPRRDVSQVRWMAAQWLGVVDGLSKIHRSDSFGPRNTQDPAADGGGELDYGIQGDIKPENILWFDDPPGTGGRLVICDYGFTRFYDRQKRSMAPSPGYSPTYRAPEMDEAGRKPISRAVDIWALGCVFLEFATWYLLGPEGVDNFVDRRNKDAWDEYHGIRIDQFFLSGPGEQACVKPSVSESIDRLKNSDHCSAFLDDFLNLIKEDMLIVEPGKRLRSSVLKRKLADLERKCQEEPEGVTYCSERSAVAESHLRSLAESSDSSPVRYGAGDYRYRYYESYTLNERRERPATYAPGSSTADLPGRDDSRQSHVAAVEGTGFRLQALQQEEETATRKAESSEEEYAQLVEETNTDNPTTVPLPPSLFDVEQGPQSEPVGSFGERIRTAFGILRGFVLYSWKLLRLSLRSLCMRLSGR